MTDANTAVLASYAGDTFTLQKEETLSDSQSAPTDLSNASDETERETAAGRSGWPLVLDAIALVAVLGALCIGAVASWETRGPYDASVWRPTPLASWLISSVVLVLVVPLVLRPRPFAAVLALATMIPTTLAVAVAFQTVGLEVALAASAGAILLATLPGTRKRLLGKTWTPVLVLACTATALAVLGCASDLVLRSLTTIDVYGPSPDGRSTLAKYSFDAGAMSALGEELIVWRDDDGGLIRHIRWVYYSDQITGRARWLTSGTVWVDGHTVNILAVPPVGWN